MGLEVLLFHALLLNFEDFPTQCVTELLGGEEVVAPSFSDSQVHLEEGREQSGRLVAV